MRERHLDNIFCLGIIIFKLPGRPICRRGSTTCCKAGKPWQALINYTPHCLPRLLLTILHDKPNCPAYLTIISHHRPVSVEQSAIIRSSCNVAHHLRTRTKDIPSPFKLCRRLSQLRSLYLPSLAIPLTLCKVSLQRSHISDTPISTFVILECGPMPNVMAALPNIGDICWGCLLYTSPSPRDS